MAEQASEASGAARSYALLIDGSTVCIRPAEATIADPVDTTAAIDAVAFRQCLEAIGADDGVDAVVSVIVPTAMGDLTEAVTAASSPRPIVAGFLRANPHGGWLPASLVRDLLDCYQIPQVSAVVARTEHDAIAAAALIGGPVVLKAEAEGIVHKTEAGAVKLDLRNLADVSAAYRDLAATFENGLTGVLVQPMLRGGIEVLIGVVQEAVFGRWWCSAWAASPPTCSATTRPGSAR